MNHLYFYSKQLLKTFEKHKKLIEFISSIKENEYIINPENIDNIKIQGTNVRDVCLKEVSNLKRKINSEKLEALIVVRSKKPIEVYELVNAFITDLNLSDKRYNDDNSLIKLLKKFPDNHTDAYSEKGLRETLDIIENSSSIHQAIQNAEENAIYIIAELSKSKKKLPTDYISLTISTDQDVPLLEEFVLIFKKINDIYDFICTIHKIDSKAKPILIHRISTGSWHLELFGVKQVVISIENLLKGFGGFIGGLIRDSITGQISKERFENECKKNKAFIGLVSFAKKNGIDNAEVGVKKKFKPLIEIFESDTTAIEINEEEILKIKETDKLTLAKRKSKREEWLERIQLIEGGKEDKTKK